MGYESEKIEWWGELRHSGMIISPILINQYYNNLNELNRYEYELAKDKYNKFKALQEIKNKEKVGIGQWIDFIFQGLLKYKTSEIEKGNSISDKYKVKTILGKKLFPDRVIKNNDKGIFIIKISDDRVLGEGKGKRNFADFLELLRENKEISLGVITNGDQFRLCYVGEGHESWVEWNSENWFLEREYINEFYGFLTLLSKESTCVENDKSKSKLINSIEESRSKQGELSNVLGEQIREIVEILISKYESTIKSIDMNILESFNDEKTYYDSIYQAASRIVMRFVVVLFAEARGMLPKDIQAYNDSYGLDGLYKELKLAMTHEGKKQLKNQYGAWPRILSLFNLIYFGSGHQIINLQAYGGEIFKSSDIDAEDDVLRVLSVFEDEKYELNDFDVYTILDKLKVGKVKVKEGKRFIWVNGPVDFSDMQTEYIGIMYQGLLDYSLNRANDVMIVLNLGDQPILPLTHLENLSDKEIKELFKKLKKSENDDKDSSNDERETEDYSISEKEIIEEEEGEISKKRAWNWAIRCIEILNLVKKTKNMDEYEYKMKCQTEAQKLIVMVYDIGGFYLVKAGGIRKGTGTYYTKPGLTKPTVKRTLEPLLYYKNGDELIPKEPENILALKVCDPACGSGSFLVAATELITDVLASSMFYYKRFEKKGSDKTRIMPYATRSKGLVEEETLSVPPENEDFEAHLRARLMRYVVERCIYGVDINSMAVELARLSLWIETMNDELPFTFLDHKVKVGNGLIGASLSNFRHYPIQAWNREGGDKEHSNGINYEKGNWTKEIKRYLKDIIKPEIVSVIEGFEGENEFNINVSEVKENRESIEKSFNEVAKLFEEFHNIPMSANGVRKRELIYRERIRNNESIANIKFDFDKWCSIWFWPGDKLSLCPTPNNFNNLNEETIREIKNIAKEQKFFHWELEFPDVFAAKESGFTAIVGNPPWDISKPNSVEFFSYYDPLFRTYEKQYAVNKQQYLYNENKLIEQRWLRSNANLKAMSNWVQFVHSPYGYDENGEKIISISKRKKQNILLHESWYTRRLIDKIYDRGATPFALQGGSDINLYKLFLEQTVFLLNNRGRLGFIVPAGIYSDKGTIDLRGSFLEKTKWEWVFSFENREKIFDIHGSFKFCVLILNKGEKTEYIKTSFMNRKVSSWEKLNVEILKYSKETIKKLSPENIALLELDSTKDLEIFNEIYDFGKIIEINTAREFDMTNDSKLFHKAIDLINQGYKINDFGIMENDKGKKYYPLYQGTSINQLDFANKKWSEEENNWFQNYQLKELKMQYYVMENNFDFMSKVKIYYRSIARNTDTRSMISTITPYYPSGNSLNKIIINDGIEGYVLTSGILSTFSYDYILRNKMIGTNVNSFILKEIPMVNIEWNIRKKIILVSAKLQLVHKVFSPQWLELSNCYKAIKDESIYKLWAVSDYERIRLRCILDSLVAYSYGLNYDDFQYILRDDESNAKGFWRVDKDKPKEVRQTTLTLVAFKDLLNRGIDNFINEEWQLPDYAGQYYGERYLPWQLEKSAEESWQECYENAKEFLGEKLFNELIEELEDKRVKV